MNERNNIKYILSLLFDGSWSLNFISLIWILSERFKNIYKDLKFQIEDKKILFIDEEQRDPA